MSGRELVAWMVTGVFVAAWVVALVVLELRRRRKARPKKLPILLPDPPRRRDHAAEHDLTGVEPTPAVELFPGVPDTLVLTECPMIDAPGGAMTLREWLKHFSPVLDDIELIAVNIWPTVVQRFYTTAAADDEIADFFRGVDMAQLQKHFLAAALMIMTGQASRLGWSAVCRPRTPRCRTRTGSRSPPRSGTR